MKQVRRECYIISVTVKCASGRIRPNRRIRKKKIYACTTGISLRYNLTLPFAPSTQYRIQTEIEWMHLHIARSTNSHMNFIIKSIKNTSFVVSLLRIVEQSFAEFRFILFPAFFFGCHGRYERIILRCIARVAHIPICGISRLNSNSILAKILCNSRTTFWPSFFLSFLQISIQLISTPFWWCCWCY